MEADHRRPGGDCHDAVEHAGRQLGRRGRRDQRSEGVTDADLRKRIQACYKLETGRALADDLKAHLSKDALTGLEAWL